MRASPRVPDISSMDLLVSSKDGAENSNRGSALRSPSAVTNLPSRGSGVNRTVTDSVALSVT